MAGIESTAKHQVGAFDQQQHYEEWRGEKGQPVPSDEELLPLVTLRGSEHAFDLGHNAVLFEVLRILFSRRNCR